MPEQYLRKMPVELLQWAPLAHECLLHKTVPATANGKWSQAAVDVFYARVKDRDCILRVFETVGGVLHVDLKVNEAASAPIYVRDLLRDLGHARLS